MGLFFNQKPTATPVKTAPFNYIVNYQLLHISETKNLFNFNDYARNQLLPCQNDF